MALIIEDGSIVAGANSFTTDAEFQAYATARNITLPATEPERDALQILAVDYLFSVEDKMKGCRVSIEQELPYPRKGVCYNGFAVPSNSIPQALKNAQMELAIQVNTSDILVSEQTQNLASFDVKDVYSESYHGGGSWTEVRTDKANAYLNPLLVNNGSNNMMSRV